MVGSGERIQSSCINPPAFHKIVRRKMVDYEINAAQMVQVASLFLMYSSVLCVCLHLNGIPGSIECSNATESHA